MFIVENMARKLTDYFLEEKFVAYSPTKKCSNLLIER